MKLISIEELKNIQLDMLQSVHDFCISHNLTYSLAYGTLLGAVRHKGYIPWDDDIDIVMPRKDYETFVETYSDKFGFYKVYELSTDKYYEYPFAKFADTRTVLEENNSAKNIGINIDIFPIDDLANSQEECTSFIDSIVPIKRKYRYKFLKPSPKNVWWKKIGILLSKLLVAQYNLRDLAIEINNKVKSVSCSNPKYVGMMVGTDAQATYKEVWDADLFTDYTMLSFENRKFMCISRYDEFLTQEYGDYMVPPSGKMKRSPHTLNSVYWKDL